MRNMKPVVNEILYKVGDTAYIVESSFMVRKAQIHNISGEFCTLRFADTGGGIRIRLNRLFPTEEAAKATLPKPRYQLAFWH